MMPAEAIEAVMLTGWGQEALKPSEAESESSTWVRSHHSTIWTTATPPLRLNSWGCRLKDRVQLTMVLLAGVTMEEAMGRRKMRGNRPGTVKLQSVGFGSNSALRIRARAACCSWGRRVWVLPERTREPVGWK